jgi:general stress protein YciG
MFEPAEAQFRSSMRELARRGGESTKRRTQKEPEYYERIGRLGGLASVEVRRRQSAALFREMLPQPVAEQSEPLDIAEQVETPCVASEEPAPDVAGGSTSYIQRLAESLAAAFEDLDRTT